MYRRVLPWHMESDSVIKICGDYGCRESIGREFTFLSWNVHKRNLTGRWREEFESLLSRHKPSILSLQEYKKRGFESFLDSHYDFNYIYGANISYRDTLSGLITLSLSKIHAESLTLTKEVEPIVKTPKIAQKSTIAMGGGEFMDVVNVHMINFVKLSKYIDELKRVLEFASGKRVSIICGDFNSWSAKRVKILHEFMREYGFESTPLKDKTHKNPTIKYPLDFIFYKGLTYKSGEVIKDIKSSDHKPIVAKFKRA
jgi:endonuclease/exonuclease/phosphatase (EEP) superfamily protein YafD